MADTDVSFRVVADCIIIVLVILPSLLLKVVGHPFHRGFFCDDENLWHPVLSQTIPAYAVAILGIMVPIALILVTELIHFSRNPRQYRMINQYVIFNRTVHPLVAMLYIAIGVFLFGAAVCQVTTDITKYAGGRLRPHFLTACQPDWSKFNCTDNHGLMQYITADVCTGDPHIIREARLSHPSGHSSFMAYTFVYLVIYLQYRFTWRGCQLLKPVLQVVSLYLVLYVCLSRISDYFHFYTDVFAGASLGTAIAFILALLIFPISKQLNLGKAEHLKMDEYPPEINYGTSAPSVISSQITE